MIAEDAIGFIDREVWHPEAPEERPEALLKTLSVGSHDADRHISDDVAEMRERIDAGLARMGWPPSCARLAVSKEGTARVIASPEELRGGEVFSWSFVWIEKNALPLSEAYFLGKMAWSLQVIEWSLEKGDMMTVFRHAMRLGAYQTEIDVRRFGLRSATVGKKQTKVLDDHRARANEKKQMKAERRQEIVAKVAAESSANRGALVREVQKHLKALGVTVTDRTIRADLKKVGKTG
jgi:hypothetical protein